MHVADMEISLSYYVSILYQGIGYFDLYHRKSLERCVLISIHSIYMMMPHSGTH